MTIFSRIYFALKNWWVEGDIDEELIEEEIGKLENKLNNLDDDKSGNFVENKNIEIDNGLFSCSVDGIGCSSQGQSSEEVLDENLKTISFFEKIAWLKLGNDRKSEIADDIVKDSHVGKLYWIQFTLSSLIVALGLLMNSIPVVIGAMLISPIMNPIKTFAFAITTGNKHMYLRSIKVLLISMSVAILSSIFISLIVPFSTLTSEVMLRISPTIVDLFVALFSGAVAFLSLGFRRLQENVAGVAMSVALLPPLSVIGIGIFFMDFSVAQGSFLLFMANLVAILIIGVMSFYMFGFFPTNKKGQKRSFVIGVMVLLSLLVVSIPLQQSMSQISDNMDVTNEITTTSENYLNSLDDNIDVSKISFKNMSEELLRVSEVVNVPDDFIITNDHKTELTKLLSMATQKSVELDLDIVEISSVYVGDKKTEKDILLDNIANTVHETFGSVFVVDHRILQGDDTLVFLNLYTDRGIDQNDVYEALFQEVYDVYGTGAKLVIQWQVSNGRFDGEKSQQEEDLEKQFYALFPNSRLDMLSVDTMTKKLSGENHDYIYVDVHFTTPKAWFRVKQLLKSRKDLLEEYFGEDVIVNSKVEYFSEFEV